MGFWDRLGDAVIKFVETLTIQDVMPASVLFLLMTAFFVMMVRAQRKPGFNIEEIFLDENRKVSMGRMLTAWCFIISGWVIMTLTYWKLITENYLWGFMIVFVLPSVALAGAAWIMSKAKAAGVDLQVPAPPPPPPAPPPAVMRTTTISELEQPPS